MPLSQGERQRVMVVIVWSVNSTTANDSYGLILGSPDGVGLRALFQALIIRETMGRIQHNADLPEPRRVADYFDVAWSSGFEGGKAAGSTSLIRAPKMV